MKEPFVLTRDMLLQGDLAARIAAANPDFRMTTDAERADSLAAILAARPDRGEGLWVFAYGSLIWNPAFHYVERRMARIDGWHRAFCLATHLGRGSPDTPGMMLGLVPGGSCEGVAFRIAEDVIELELDIVWRRELIGEGYVPRWVKLWGEGGEDLGAAVAFTVNEAGPHYAADVPEPELVRRLAFASGYLGTMYDYLFRTESGLAAFGVDDPCVSRMADLVRQVHMDTMNCE